MQPENKNKNNQKLKDFIITDTIVNEEGNIKAAKLDKKQHLFRTLFEKPIGRKLSQLLFQN